MRALIAIPSKQRLGARLLRELLEEGVPFTLFTDAEEAGDYSYAYPGATIETHACDTIGAIRAWIVDWARRQDSDLLWMVDDDLSAAWWRPPGSAKHQRISWKRWFESMEREAAHWPTCAILGPKPRQYAWQDERPTLNVHTNGIALLRLDAPIQYEPWPAFEDAEIVCQALAAGWHTVRWTQWAYDMPKMATLEGGMTDAYLAGAAERSRPLIIEKWADRGVISSDGLRIQQRQYERPVRVA